MEIVGLINDIDVDETEDENQIKFNDEETFNEIIKVCQKGR